MADPVGLLEDRVGQAIERLARLSRERIELLREVEQLRERLVELERDARGSRRQHEQEAWRRDREQVVSVLRETLVELRHD